MKQAEELREEERRRVQQRVAKFQVRHEPALAVPHPCHTGKLTGKQQAAEALARAVATKTASQRAAALLSRQACTEDVFSLYQQARHRRLAHQRHVRSS